MENEKDIFDLLREESENLSETPPTEAWQRLEKRLTKTRKVKRKRRPMQLQLVAICIAVILILLVSVVSWYVTKQHEDILRGRREFAGLRFLKGQWVSSDKKTLDVVAWDLKDSLLLMGEKSLYFGNNLISKTPVTIKNVGKDNILIYNNKNYLLKDIKNNTFIFNSKNGGEVRLRKASDDRFTLSFGEGMIFVFKKEDLNDE